MILIKKKIHYIKKEINEQENIILIEEIYFSSFIQMIEIFIFILMTLIFLLKKCC